MRTTTTIVCLGAWLALLSMPVGCKAPKAEDKEEKDAKKSAKAMAGDGCKKDGARTCADAETELVCQGESWRPYACRGPDGCSKDGDGARCDLRGNDNGERCAKADEGASACASKTARVTCSGGKILKEDCKGPRGCFMEGDKAQCDRSISSVGAACSTEGAVACSQDQKDELLCKNGQNVPRRSCRGKKGCWIDSAKNLVFCDQSVAYIGDECTQDGTGTCTADGHLRLSCKNGQWVVGDRCYGAKGCWTDLQKNQVMCE
jgi:hypothetical protein